MKESLELEKIALEKFKHSIKEQSVLTMEDLEQIVTNYEQLIHKIQAYQQILNELVQQRHIDRHIAK